MVRYIYLKRVSHFLKISIFLILLAFSSCTNKILAQNIKNGEIDLSHWDFSKNIANIGGVAIFYPNNFYSIAEIKNTQAKNIPLNIEHSWNNQSKQQNNFDTHGFGTYYFSINIPENYIGKSFLIRPNHFIAYASEIYVNNQLVGHSGYVGKSAIDSNYRPARNIVVNPFIADSSVLDVVILVANFNHFRGGIFNKIQFGLAENMIQQNEKAIAFDLIVIISLLIMFLYHFTLYFVNTRESTALFFSFTSLIFAIDFSFQDTMSFFLFFPNAPFKLISFLHQSMPYLLPSTFIFFLYSLFPNEVSKRIRNITVIISIILIVSTILSISQASSYIVKPHFFYNLLLIIYIYIVVIKAVKAKRDGAVLFLIAFVIFSVCAINDILFVFEIIYTTSLVSSGLIVFVFLLSVMQGRRMLLMYSKNLKLSNNLKKLNVSLENQVQDRTHKLNESLKTLTKLSQFKEDMTNMIVHDLKAPLSAVINIKIIDKQKRNDLVQQAGYRMLNLVENILSVYKYENTKFKLHTTNVSLIDIINKALEELVFLTKQKSLTIKIAEELNCIINVDEDIIRRVFVNLLTNAVKFSPPNAIIDIKAVINDDKVSVSVTNQGVGIDKENQKMIFERFNQAEKKSIGKISSTGLGLTFCKLAVEAHGGTISVNSKLKKGSTFKFTLPKA